ncbi:PAS domain-containing sensor histidine kinase [Chitinilyticum piscinae]|uniref:histidine kinase n=1 Tax=Chitinilyticum piscinae TaxID=2866724 RepID=A0A8J7FLY2_9NEIS|nr:PAS domain-containing sensor histidine kinase [Chitinilyticum piscinae]MBE9610185.1 PAS domain S-box protein [Chitinilyticum piscinae]
MTPPFRIRFRAWRFGQWPWHLGYALLGLLAFALGLYLWLDWQKESALQQATMAQDLLWQEQEIRVRLQTNQNVLENLAYALAAGVISTDDFRVRAEALMRGNPEILAIEWVDSAGVRQAGLPVFSSRPSSLPALDESRVQEMLDGAAILGYPVYSNVLLRHESAMVMQAVPFFRGTAYRGAVLITYALPGLLQQRVPWWMVQRYDLQLVDVQGKVLAPLRNMPLLQGTMVREVSFDPPGQGLRLRAVAVKQQHGAWVRLGIWGLVLSFLLLLAWMLRLMKQRLLERQQAERELTDEILFRSAMENSLVSGLWAMDRDGRMIYVNPAFAQMVGWRSMELVGCRAPLPFWPAEQLQECTATYEAMLRGECPPNGFESRFVRRDGERFDVRLYTSRLVDSAGQERGWMASLYDITELRQEKEALAASRQQLLTVLDGLMAAVSVWDMQTGELRYRNGHHATTFRLPEDAGAVCLLPMQHDRSQPGEGVVADCYDQLSARWYQVQRRPIVWVDGRGAWLEIATDITAQRQAEDADRVRDEKLQLTARLVSMGELASSLAHELNQPLAAIASYSAACGSLLDMPEPALPKVRATLDKIGEQSRRAGKIIRGIREFVLKRQPTSEWFSIDELLEMPKQLLEPLARRSSASIVVNLPRRLPQVCGDRVMLEQVIFNLLRNAIEAMADTPVERRSVSVTASRDDHYVIIHVADHGSGLAEPARLFQPFFSTKPDGMGMGLNICRSIIEQHRGHLWAEANPEGGTVFSFRLPLIQAGTTNQEST